MVLLDGSANERVDELVSVLDSAGVEVQSEAALNLHVICYQATIRLTSCLETKRSRGLPRPDGRNDEGDDEATRDNVCS